MPVAFVPFSESECSLTGGVAGIFLVGELPGERPRPQPFSLAFVFLCAEYKSRDRIHNESMTNCNFALALQ